MLAFECELPEGLEKHLTEAYQQINKIKPINQKIMVRTHNALDNVIVPDFSGFEDVWARKTDEDAWLLEIALSNLSSAPRKIRAAFAHDFAHISLDNSNSGTDAAAGYYYNKIFAQNKIVKGFPAVVAYFAAVLDEVPANLLTVQAGYEEEVFAEYLERARDQFDPAAFRAFMEKGTSASIKQKKEELKQRGLAPEDCIKSKELFLPSLEIPLFAELYLPNAKAKEILKTYWDGAERAGCAQDTPHPLDWYKKFIEVIAKQKLYEKPIRLVDLTLRKKIYDKIT